jgi:subtilisin family serine protease
MNTTFFPDSSNKTFCIGFLISSMTLFALAGCGSGSNSSQPALTEIDGNADIAEGKKEVDRLRFFREIKADKARKNFNVTGSGVRITIMGEVVDVSHPDINRRVIKQYNTFSDKGIVNTGIKNEAYKIDLFGRGEGHGTHIAGTIAAECDGKGIQGVACSADLDVYDLGAYENERLPVNGWGNIHEMERFLGAFNHALRDIVKRKSSRILTGSFNQESPAIRLRQGGSLENQSLSQIIKAFEQEEGKLSALNNKGLVRFEDDADIEYITRVTNNNGGDESIAAGVLLPLSKQWKELEDTIKAYQDSDGVYIITESNNLFENRTSVLNAMPTLSTKVDPALWISAVMAVPKGYFELTNNPDSTVEELNQLMKGEYITPINSCGEMAAEYCILIPSYSVLSTMTRKVADQSIPFFNIDGRGYQILSGHSMGAPMIAGALALMEEYNVRKGLGYKMKDLVRILKDNANRSFPGFDATKHGKGLLDIEAALKAMG